MNESRQEQGTDARFRLALGAWLAIMAVLVVLGGLVAIAGGAPFIGVVVAAFGLFGAFAALWSGKGPPRS